MFLLDVDNTLLDNDRFARRSRRHLERAFGADERQRYWRIFERAARGAGAGRLPRALQAFRSGLEDRPELLHMSEFMLDTRSPSCSSRSRSRPSRICKFGRPVVLSDGDIVFQPRKIQRAGIWDTVEGRVLIYLHKERCSTTFSGATRRRIT